MRFRPNSVLLPVLAWVAPVCLLLTPLTTALASQGDISGPRTGVWAHETSPLQPDGDVVWGRLDNGLRYALLPHRGVPGRVSLRLIVLTGSLDERDNERGIAHYIEHLAFRDTRNFTTEEQVAFFQRLGMDPNGDVNAMTGHEVTVYMVECREGRPEFVDQALMWMRNVGDGIAFRPKEIDEERGVILSEMRVRGGLLAENADASSPVLFKGMRFTQRDPGGTTERIRNLQREDFLEFYNRNYRSDQMIVVAVGDFDVPNITGMITNHFAGMVRPEAPLPPRDTGRLDTSRSLRGGTFRISDVGAAQLVVGSTIPIADRPDSVDARADEFRREFAMAVFNERVAKDTQGNARYDRIYGMHLATAQAVGDPEEWARGLGILDDLVRFTHQKGFEQRELDMVKRRFVARNEFMLEQTATMDPAGLAQMLVESITEHRVFVDLETELRWQKDWLARMNARELHAAFQSCWDLERMAFFVGGEVMIEGGAAEVVKKVQDARRSGLRYFRPETRKEIAFKLPKWGPPGEVVDTKEVPEFDARLMRFDNNVRLNFAPSRSDPGVVHVIARFGTGVLEMPEHQPALKDVALQTLLSGGTTHFTPEQLHRIAEDHLFDISVDMDENDAFAFRASVSPEKIEIPLALIADFLHRPIFGSLTHREETAKAMLNRFLNRGGMSDGERQLQDYLFRGDPRFTSPNESDYLRVSTVDVRDWLQEPFTRGYLEVTIVGDIEEAAAVEAMARTLGSLKDRALTKSLRFPAKPVKLSAPAGFKRIEFVGEKHLGLVAGDWPIQEEISVRGQASLMVLAKVLEQHVFREVRSRLGLAYSPMVQLQRFSGFYNFALMRARVPCDPSDASRVATLLEEIAADLAEGGITQDEFIGARGVLAGQLRFASQSAGFVLGAMRRAQENPDSLQGNVELSRGLIEEITLEEVNTWAKKILPRDNSRTAAMVPKPFIGVFQTQGP